MKLKINNNTYKILIVDKEDERVIIDNYSHSGLTDFILKEIYIRNDLNDDSLRYTIIHELTHAYLESYGFLQVDYTDEIIADITGNYLINIYNDYNKVYKYYKQNVI